MDKKAFRARLRRGQVRLVHDKNLPRTPSNDAAQVVEIAEDTLCQLSKLHITTRNAKALQIADLTDKEFLAVDNSDGAKCIQRHIPENDVSAHNSVMAVKKPLETEPLSHIEVWGQRVPYATGAPEVQRDFELLRMWRRIEELEADKKNLLENLTATKRALQDHHTMWSIYLREKSGPTYAEAKRLQMSCESAIGRLDQLSNGHHSFELLPDGHPWKKNTTKEK